MSFLSALFNLYSYPNSSHLVLCECGVCVRDHANNESSETVKQHASADEMVSSGDLPRARIEALVSANRANARSAAREELPMYMKSIKHTHISYLWVWERNQGDICCIVWADYAWELWMGQVDCKPNNSHFPRLPTFNEMDNGKQEMPLLGFIIWLHTRILEYSSSRIER